MEKETQTTTSLEVEQIRMSEQRFWYGFRTKEEKTLDFATSCDLLIANTCFVKCDEHLSHIKAGYFTQIDFFYYEEDRQSLL